jgi:hypothetical protein
MSEVSAQNESEVPTEVDPIKPMYEGECPSISGRSTITFVIGRHEGDASLHLRIAHNSGKGMWFDGWASAAAIDALVIGAEDLTAKSFHPLHPGRSINTGGFVLAALKELGLIRANEVNTRLHEHVPTETFEKVAMAVIDPGVSTKKSKAPKNKPKDAG